MEITTKSFQTISNCDERTLNKIRKLRRKLLVYYCLLLGLLIYINYIFLPHSQKDTSSFAWMTFIYRNSGTYSEQFYYFNLLCGFSLMYTISLPFGETVYIYYYTTCQSLMKMPKILKNLKKETEEDVVFRYLIDVVELINAYNR